MKNDKSCPFQYLHDFFLIWKRQVLKRRARGYLKLLRKRLGFALISYRKHFELTHDRSRLSLNLQNSANRSRTRLTASSQPEFLFHAYSHNQKIINILTLFHKLPKKRILAIPVYISSNTLHLYSKEKFSSTTSNPVVHFMWAI